MYSPYPGSTPRSKQKEETAGIGLVALGWAEPDLRNAEVCALVREPNRAEDICALEMPRKQLAFGRGIRRQD